VATHRFGEPLTTHVSTRDVDTDIVVVFAMVVLRDGDRHVHRLQPHPLLFEREVVGQLCPVVMPIIDAVVTFLVRFKTATGNRITVFLQML